VAYELPKTLRTMGFIPKGPVRGFQAFGSYWLVGPYMRPRIILPDSKGELTMVPAGLIMPAQGEITGAEAGGGSCDVGDHYIYQTFYRSLDGAE